MQRKLKILVVDDVEMNRVILAELFGDVYNVLEAENGVEALEIIRKNPDISAILLDIVMPVLDGIETLERIKQEGLIPFVPIFFVTSDTSNKTLVKGFENGIVDRIAKPFNPYVIKRRVQNSIELYDYRVNLERRVQEQTEEIEKKSKELKDANASIIDALSTAIEFRDSESGEHVQRIKEITRTLLLEFEKHGGNKWYTHNEIEDITAASVMHDVGKISVPDYILNKPGKLTDEEFEIMKEHSVNGCKILDSIDVIKGSPMYKYYYDICRSHHERWNGRGYPDGLKGDEIPISAQIVSIADVYDALSSERVYKPAYSHDESVRMILDGECGEFNPELMESFKKVNKKLKNNLEKLSQNNNNKLDIPVYERKIVDSNASNVEVNDKQQNDDNETDESKDSMGISQKTIEMFEQENVKFDKVYVLSEDIVFKYRVDKDSVELSRDCSEFNINGRVIENAHDLLFNQRCLPDKESKKIIQKIAEVNYHNPYFTFELNIPDKYGNTKKFIVYILYLFTNDDEHRGIGCIGKMSQVVDGIIDNKIQIPNKSYDFDRGDARHLFDFAIGKEDGRNMAILYTYFNNFSGEDEKFSEVFGKITLEKVSNNLKNFNNEQEHIHIIGSDQFVTVTYDEDTIDLIERTVDEMLGKIGFLHEKPECTDEAPFSSVSVSYYPIEWDSINKSENLS